MVYGLWLNNKGKVLADSFILRGGAGEFWIGSYFSPADLIRERLERYIIADDVAVTDESGRWFGMTLLGDEGAARERPAGALLFPGRRGVAACEWMTEGAPGGNEAPQLGAAELERLRIHASIPAVPADLGPGELPNEGGLERDAISYTKGCYLGQEVMARLKTMGQVRRRLKRVTGTGEVARGPLRLYQGAKPVGELRTTVAEDGGFTGLALLTLLALQPEAPLSLGPDLPPSIALAEPL